MRGWPSFAVLVAVIGACATAPQPRSHPAPPVDELKAALERRQSALRTLNLETRTTSWLGGERTRAKVLMLIDRPGRLRFDAEIPLQGTVASLAVTRDEFALLDLQQHVLKRGLACPENVATLIRIPLRPEEISAILLGDAPFGEGARAVNVGWDSASGLDVLEVTRPGGGDAGGDAATHLWISFRKTSTGWQIAGVEGQSGTASGRWRVRYEDFEAVSGLGVGVGIDMPATIRFAEVGKSFDEGVEIKVRDRSVNVALPDAAFRLTPPAGFAVEQIPCLPGPP